MRQYLITLFYILSSIAISSQDLDFQWARSFSSDNHQNPTAIAVDSLGNSYVTGYFFGVLDFDPGVGNYEVTSNGHLDIFVVKLDPSGNFVWGRSFGSTQEDRGVSLDVDDNGNVYVVGRFKGMVDFDPGINNYMLSSNAISDTFILKLDSNGDFVWAKSIGGPGHDVPYDMFLDNNGNVLVTGEYWVTVDFDPGNGDYNLTAIGNNSDVYILKLDANGDFVWAKSVGGASQDFGRSIVQDKNGNVIVVGEFSDTADFDPGTTNYDLISNGDWDVFVVKLDINGDFVWARSYGGPVSDPVFRVNTDMYGDIYITGDYVGTVDFDPGTGVNNMTFQGVLSGNWDTYALKLDEFGQFVWSRSFGGDEVTKGVFSTTDEYGNLFMTGWFEGVSDFDPGNGVLNLPQNNAPNVFNDIFLLQLDRCGNLLWATSFHGESKNDGGVDVALDASCNLYLTGYLRSDSIDFDTGNALYYLLNDTLTDTYVSKYQIKCPFGVDTVLACGSYTWIDGNTYNSNNDTSEYIIEGGNSKGCDSIVKLDLTVIQNPVINLSYTSEAVCQGVKFNFLVDNQIIDEVNWNFGNGDESTVFSPSVIFPYSSNHTIHITASTVGTCTTTLDTTITIGSITDYYNLEPPNVFTPNNDGVNDEFTIEKIDQLLDCMELTVYNRWGQEVFISNQFSSLSGELVWNGNGKNGKPVPEGMYYYLLKMGVHNYSGVISIQR